MPLQLFDQGRPAFGEGPFDRPPLQVVDFQFQTIRPFCAMLGCRIGLKAISPCGLSRVPIFCFRALICSRVPSPEAVLTGQFVDFGRHGKRLFLRTTDGECPVQNV